MQIARLVAAYSLNQGLACNQHILPALAQSLATSTTAASPAVDVSVASSSAPHLTCLKESRAVVRVSGAQAVPFLQGMVTNDVRSLEQPGAAPVYAALLSPKGKFLHDLILYQEQGNKDSLLMEVDASGAEEAIGWLTRYKLRKPVQIDDVSEEHAVWALHGRGVTVHSSSSSSQSPTAAAGAAGTSTAHTGWWPDPRLPQLGLRSIFPAGQTPPVAAVLQSDGGPAGLQSGAVSLDESGAAYRAWRYLHGVPEGEVEIPAGKAAPLDYNLDMLNGVSYTKGCYIGQERNSFTHYRGIIRKRCMPFRLITPTGSTQEQQAAAQALQPGADIAADPLQASSQPTGAGSKARDSVGTVRGFESGMGLAYIRLAPAIQAELGQLLLQVDGLPAGARLVPFRPGWWPREWGLEE